MSRTFTIKDTSGLHARPAALVVNEAAKHENEINIIYKGTSYNLKSIMIVMSLGVKHNEEFSIEVNGENSNEVLDSLEKILRDHKLV